MARIIRVCSKCNCKYEIPHCESGPKMLAEFDSRLSNDTKSKRIVFKEKLDRLEYINRERATGSLCLGCARYKIDSNTSITKKAEEESSSFRSNQNDNVQLDKNSEISNNQSCCEKGILNNETLNSSCPLTSPLKNENTNLCNIESTMQPIKRKIKCKTTLEPTINDSSSEIEGLSEVDGKIDGENLASNEKCDSSKNALRSQRIQPKDKLQCYSNENSKSSMTVSLATGGSNIYNLDNRSKISFETIEVLYNTTNVCTPGNSKSNMNVIENAPLSKCTTNYIQALTDICLALEQYKASLICDRDMGKNQGTNKTTRDQLRCLINDATLAIQRLKERLQSGIDDENDSTCSPIKQSMNSVFEAIKKSKDLLQMAIDDDSASNEKLQASVDAAVDIIQQSKDHLNDSIEVASKLINSKNSGKVQITENLPADKEEFCQQDTNLTKELTGTKGDQDATDKQETSTENKFNEEKDDYSVSNISFSTFRLDDNVNRNENENENNNKNKNDSDNDSDNENENEGKTESIEEEEFQSIYTKEHENIARSKRVTLQISKLTETPHANQRTLAALDTLNEAKILSTEKIKANIGIGSRKLSIIKKNTIDDDLLTHVEYQSDSDSSDDVAFETTNEKYRTKAAKDSPFQKSNINEHVNFSKKKPKEKELTTSKFGETLNKIRKRSTVQAKKPDFPSLRAFLHLEEIFEKLNKDNSDEDKEDRNTT